MAACDELLVICFLLIVQQVVTGKECGQPGEPANGSLMSTEILFYPGEEVTYSCRSGYVLAGSERRMCGDDGIWSGSLPSCKENLALSRPTTQSDILWSYGPDLAVDGDPNTCSFTSREQGEQRWWQVQLKNHPLVEYVWVTMSPGAYQKFAIFVVEILDGNTAEYKPCAQFEGRFHEQQVRFECNSGDGQTGQFVYIRDDRVDREYFGLCEVQVFQRSDTPQCGQPEVPVYSQLTHLMDSSSVQYSCSQGYTLIGDKIRNCTQHGWIGQVPVCKEVKCDHPTSTKDGFIEVSNFRGSYVYGSRATYHCNPGYILWGNSTRLCDSSGLWTGTAPQCRLISCGDPPMLPHSAVALLNGSTQWRAQAVYSCLPGYNNVHGGPGNQDQAEAVCQDNGHWSPVRLSCGGHLVTSGQDTRTNVFYVTGDNGDVSQQTANVSSATLTIIGILAAVILGTAVLSTAILLKKWLTKHIYYPGGVSVTAEKPLIYDKIDNIGGGGVGPVGVAGGGAGGDQCSYQTTVMSTFRHTTDTSSSSAESSCSALCSTNEKHCPTMQTILTTGYNPKRRVLNTYSSLPRPGHTHSTLPRPAAATGSHLIGWSYADQSEVSNHTLLSRRVPEGGPEYANLIPWSSGETRTPQPQMVHYATLGRAQYMNKRLIASQCQNSSDEKELNVSDSIPDILQTLSTKPHTSKPNQANVIVNELSDRTMEADLVDLNSPEHGHLMNNNQRLCGEGKPGDGVDSNETNGF